jgi:hypothetical protein
MNRFSTVGSFYTRSEVFCKLNQNCCMYYENEKDKEIARNAFQQKLLSALRVKGIPIHGQGVWLPA